MNILVTGSTGFVGKYFSDNYSNEFKITKVNLRTTKVKEIDFSGIDSVLHLAAIVHQMREKPGVEYYSINRDLTMDIASRAKEKGVKQFILMSTAKVYGEITPDNSKWDENSNCNPMDFYAKSKYEAELLVQSLQDNNFKVAVIRSPLIYGIGVKANMYKLIKLTDKYPVLPFGGINNRRALVFIGNLTALIKQIILRNESGIFIAGDLTTISTTDLIMLIAKALNKKVYLLKIPYFLRYIITLINPAIINRLFASLILDNSLTNKKLAFSPPYSIGYGINEMVQWYKLSKTKKK